MKTAYALLWLLCLAAFLHILLEWIRSERAERRRRKVLEVHARKLNVREVF